MKIYDVTLPIHQDMLVWEGDAKVSVRQIATLKKDSVSLSQFSLGSHTGTHVDAPSHFLEDGEPLDKIPLKNLIGKCQVLDLTNIDHQEIQVSDLLGVSIQKNDRILFKTGNFNLLQNSTFPNSYISLSLEAAEFLAEKGVVLVGTDFLGIEKKGNPGHPVHKALLSKGVVIVEGLNFKDVSAGVYNLICLPLNVVGVDGAPARVVLIEE